MTVISITNKQDKIDALTAYIDAQGQWYSDYQEHEDNINNYAELFETHSLHFGEIDIHDIGLDDMQVLKALIEDLDAYGVLELCDEPFFHHGFSRCTNEIWSVNIGEVECQISGTPEYDTLIKGLSEADINKAGEASGYCCRKGEYVYLDFSYDRISICINIDKVKEYIKDKDDLSA